MYVPGPIRVVTSAVSSQVVIGLSIVDIFWVGPFESEVTDDFLVDDVVPIVVQCMASVDVIILSVCSLSLPGDKSVVVSVSCSVAVTIDVDGAAVVFPTLVVIVLDDAVDASVTVPVVDDKVCSPFVAVVVAIAGVVVVLSYRGIVVVAFAVVTAAPIPSVTVIVVVGSADATVAAVVVVVTPPTEGAIVVPSSSVVMYPVLVLSSKCSKYEEPKVGLLTVNRSVS